MALATMGKVLVSAKIENVEDVYAVAQARVTPDQIRTIEVSDALVDTGAVMLSLPHRFIEQLAAGCLHRACHHLDKR